MKDLLQFNQINFDDVIKVMGILSTKSNDPVLRYQDERIEDEFKKICRKESKLSKNQRSYIIQKYSVKHGIEETIKNLKGINQNGN